MTVMFLSPVIFRIMDEQNKPMPAPENPEQGMPAEQKEGEGTQAPAQA